MFLVTKLRVIGHSMEPAIKNGNFVLGSSIPYLFSSPKKEDVAFFRKDGKVFLKRINKIMKNKFFMAGDNSKDSINVWIDRKEILGKIIYGL